MTLTPDSPDGFLVCGFNTEKQDILFLLRGHLDHVWEPEGMWWGQVVFVWQNFNESALLVCFYSTLDVTMCGSPTPHILDTILEIHIDIYKVKHIDWLITWSLDLNVFIYSWIILEIQYIIRAYYETNLSQISSYLLLLLPMLHLTIIFIIN